MPREENAIVDILAKLAIDTLHIAWVSFVAMQANKDSPLDTPIRVLDVHNVDN